MLGRGSTEAAHGQLTANTNTAIIHVMCTCTTCMLHAHGAYYNGYKTHSAPLSKCANASYSAYIRWLAEYAIYYLQAYSLQTAQGPKGLSHIYHIYINRLQIAYHTCHRHIAYAYVKHETCMYSRCRCPRRSCGCRFFISTSRSNRYELATIKYTARTAWPRRVF
jgi:hypothetical protein